MTANLHGAAPDDMLTSLHKAGDSLQRATSPAVLQRAAKLGMLWTEAANREAYNATTTAMALPTRTDPAVWTEWLELQAAVWQRCQALSAQWFAGCAQLLEERSQLGQANTLSKFVAQECNVAAQFSALLTSQATSAVELAETVQVGYGYWVEEKLRRG